MTSLPPSNAVLGTNSGLSSATNAAHAGSVRPHVALLTGGDDRSYAHGLAMALGAAGIAVDFIGSDALDGAELRATAGLRFLNLRGDQNPYVPLREKAARIVRYYLRLLRYAARGRPRLFHILWNNKVEWFDRTLLMLWYRAWNHEVFLTAHNVNAARRDGRDSFLNRATLRSQYRLCRGIFVHTQAMKQELVREFGIEPQKVHVIPFGLNDTAPRRGLSRAEARRRLGLDPNGHVALFFGQIAPYKGLDVLLEAVVQAAAEVPSFRLMIAGKVKKGEDEYWARLDELVASPAIAPHVVARIGHVPDEDIEAYFEAADVLVLPYVRIFQSGLPFLAFSFGLPVIATDVGSLAEDIVDGHTGFLCRPHDPAALAGAIRDYFFVRLYANLAAERLRIAAHARERYSWAEVARITRAAYLPGNPGPSPMS